MRVAVLIAMFLGCYVLCGCLDRSKRTESNADQNVLSGRGGAAQLNALTVEEAENFIQSWCGSGVLTNLRKLDADEYLVSADMPSWLNVVKTDKMDSGLADDEKRDERRQEQFIGNLKKFPIFNAMFPTGKMILADFSSGSGCRNTLVAIDALAAAYLKKLKDTSSANALTCERKSKSGYHRLDIKVPYVKKILDATSEESLSDDPDCDGTLAHVLVGHKSTGTLTLSSVYGDTRVEEPPLFDFTLVSFILEADGRAQFLRSDGAMKFFYSHFSAMFGRRQQSSSMY